MSRFTILMYHAISEPSSENDRKYACPPDRFARHMKSLRKHGFNLTSLDVVCRYLQGSTSLAPHSTVVTLDDGFRDNYENAFPILQQYRIPATIFLTVGLIEPSNDGMNSGSLPRKEMLTWGQIMEMRSAGISFGAHTMSHPRLIELNETEAFEEISSSKEILENHLGNGVDFFAYPHGAFNETLQQLVRKAGFKLACSSRPGFNNAETNPYILRRIEVYGTDGVRRLHKKLTFGVNNASVSLSLKYYIRRARRRLRTLTTKEYHSND